MYLSRNTIDSLLRDVYEALLCEKAIVEAHKGKFKEVIGACLHLTNPRARLSRSESKGKIYSALGELLWYLSGDTRLDFIDYYIPNTFQDESDDQVHVRSGYGDRLFSWRGINQVNNVIELLGRNVTTRRAVIQLFDASDIAQRFASAPCTCTLQFLAREERLHMFVSMRSNDAFLGLPHDIFAFTMLQELVARSTGLELGEYRHCAGSLHLYERHFNAAQQYLNEGWQDLLPMPPMPLGDPWTSVRWLQEVEATIRIQGDTGLDIQSADVGEYWQDLGRLLQSLRASKGGDAQILANLMAQMQSDAYKMFLMARLDRAEQEQLEIGARP